MVAQLWPVTLPGFSGKLKQPLAALCGHGFVSTHLLDHLTLPLAYNFYYVKYLITCCHQRCWLACSSMKIQLCTVKRSPSTAIVFGKYTILIRYWTFMIISVCHSYLLSSVFLYFSIVFSYRMKEMNWLSVSCGNNQRIPDLSNCVFSHWIHWSP